MDTTHSNIVNKLNDLIVKYESIENLNAFNISHNLPRLEDTGTFSRERKMTFADMLGFMLYPRSESMNVELLKYSHLIGKPNVNKSDFSRRRKLIPAEYLKEMNNDLLEQFYERGDVLTWHDYLLIAGDGTTYTLPDTAYLRDVYLEGRKTGHSAQAMARGIVLKDILNDKIVASNMECYGDDEIHLVCKELDTLPHIGHKQLLLLDRKYCSYILLVKLMQLGIDFVIRVKRRFSQTVDSFLESDEKFADVELTPAMPSIRKLHRLYGDGDYTHFKVRLVKISRDVAVMTSVKDDSFIDDIDDLYHGRWDVETTIGFDKNCLQVEIFSGISQTAMQQDFYAKTIDYNILSILVCQAASLRHDAEAKDGKGTTMRRRINRNVALGIMALNFGILITHTGKCFNKSLNRVLKEMARFMVPVKKHRHNPRLFRNIKTSGKYITLPNYRRAI